MALKAQSQGRWWSRFHFLLCFAGLTGLVVAAAGSALAFLEKLHLWDWDVLRPAVLNEAGTLPAVAVYLVLGGGLAVVTWVLVELFRLVFLTTGRRSTFGLNAALQVVLIIALVAAVNVYAFSHYLRFDWTRDKQFTLSQPVQEQLRQLNGKTTVVVYQQHKTFGALSEKTDRYDAAARHKVVEKVNDLVEQVREFGPQFEVVVLDVDSNEFNDKLSELTSDAPELRKAIDNAPDDSIFFYAREEGKDKGEIQRLSFNALYQLDKSASLAANDKQGNLVLRHRQRGVDAFTRRVLNIDVKRPKVAVLTIHEALSTKEGDIIGLKGLARSLRTHGFEVVDVILKKESQVGPLEPVVYTYEENRFDSLQDELAGIKEENNRLVEGLKTNAAIRKKVADGDDALLAQVLSVEQFNLLLSQGRLIAQERLETLFKEELKKADAERKKVFLERGLAFIDLQSNGIQADIKANEKDMARAQKDRDALNVESVTELRRMTDLKAKLDRLLADCDLVIVPRFTIYTLAPTRAIPSDLHQLNTAQVGAIKKFLADGKPLLACFGPSNEQPRGRPAPPSQPDELEDMLGKLGIRFGNQVVLFRSEAKTFAGGPQDNTLRAAVDIPPVEFDWSTPTGAQLPPGEEAHVPPNPNPIRESMRIAEHSIGKSLNLQVHFGRPVYYVPNRGEQPAFDPVIMRSNEKSWNEDNPFASANSRPRPPREEDPHGTLEKKGNGPFPLGVAVETDVPAGWGDSKGGRGATVRVAALGHGGLFTGDEVTPAKEKLLIDTCNWLVGRDDLLAQEDPKQPDKNVWKYPRLTHFSGLQLQLWQWGTPIGLVLVFFYLGVVVVLVRRLR